MIVRCLCFRFFFFQEIIDLVFCTKYLLYQAVKIRPGSPLPGLIVYQCKSEIK